MRTNHIALSALFLCSGALARLHAGHIISEPAAPAATTAYAPLGGTLTLGLGFTADQIGGQADLLAPVYRAADQRSMLFLDGHGDGNGGGNENASAGAGFRHRFESPDIILGLNAFYDYGNYSGHGTNQLGVGLELLSKWVDFRANGYFPETSERAFDRYSTTSSSTTSAQTTRSIVTGTKSVLIDGGEGQNDRVDTTTTTKTTTQRKVTTKQEKRTYERREAFGPGLDVELGGLVPFKECWVETRLYAGYAYFDGEYASDISCFTARLECRPVPAVVFDVQYKGDSRLVDGENHWIFGARVEIPFDLGNLCQGQSPFAGITDAFTFRCRGGDPGVTSLASYSKDGKQSIAATPDLQRNRMNEEIQRNWRPIITRSGPEKVSDQTSVKEQTFTTSKVSQTTTTRTVQPPAGPPAE